MRDSEIILVKNMKIDKNYKNVLSYNEEQMINLCRQNQVATSNEYSFIKENINVINTKFSYSECMKANYVAFRNPTYSNKWFFAFIDSIEFVSPGATKLYITNDIFSTWYQFWNPTTCFIIREHVNNDKIGLHTVPENLELGDYVLNASKENFMDKLSNYAICMAVTELPDESVPPYSNHRNYNGIFGGLYYLGFSDAVNCETAIKMYDKLGKSDAINSIFMIPNNLISYTEGTQTLWTIESVGSCTLVYLKAISVSDTLGSISVELPNKIGNSYKPKNNKLFTYPYCFFNLANNSGTTETFKYEDFSISDETHEGGFRVDACLTPGMSIKAIPVFYKNENYNNNYGIVAGKLPICSYQSDVYLNWLRQNGLNSAFNIIGGVVSAAAGIGVGSISATVGGLAGIYSSVHQVELAQMTPNQAKGNTNAGDIKFSNEEGMFTVYKMSIKDEYARIIDDYFTREGYKVNRLKVPNITGRKYFNYVQIAESENIGYPNNLTYSVPSNVMDQINNIFRSGVTIWHDYKSLGDYSVNNTIN